MNVNNVIQGIVNLGGTVFGCPSGLYSSEKGLNENGFVVRADGYAVQKRQLSGSDCLLAEDLTLTCIYSARMSNDMNVYESVCEKCFEFVRSVVMLDGVNEAIVRDVDFAADGDFVVASIGVSVSGLANA